MFSAALIMSLPRVHILGKKRQLFSQNCPQMRKNSRQFAAIRGDSPHFEPKSSDLELRHLVARQLRVVLLCSQQRSTLSNNSQQQQAKPFRDPRAQERCCAHCRR